jgi:hypothetical protein
MTITTKLATAATHGDIMESVIAKGDLGKMEPADRVRYYNEVCRSMGLNPLTQPFSYITLNGKLTLYATRTCADQLRKINGVSLEIVSREIADDVLTVHVRAKLPDGRSDEDLGAVSFPSTLKGEARANAELKAVTKAKRRATLSICGLGWLDETEVDDIPASAKHPARPAPNVMLPAHDAQTGEVVEETQPSPPASEAAPSPSPSTQPKDGAVGLWEDYVERWTVIMDDATDAKQLHETWTAGRAQRNKITWPDDDTFANLKTRVEAKIKALR